jgi:hypothetical protein
MSFDPGFLARNSEMITRFFVGDLEYVLLIISMLMTRMLMLRIIAVSSGVAGATYSFVWLSDPIGTFWEVLFTLVNLGQITLITYRNASARFNDDEQAFYAQVVPTLEPFQVHRLLRIGIWLDAEAGTELTQQGELVPHLIFVKSGQASIFVDRKLVGCCAQGSLIGEISIRTGEPATATAVVKEAMRYLALERKALNKLMKADSEIAHAIDVGNRKNLESKLLRMNETALQPGTRMQGDARPATTGG